MHKANNWKADPSEAQYIEKRERIIDAAARVISEQGLKNLKLETLSSEISINRSTYYRYFSSKEELIRAVLNKEFELLSEEIFQKTAHIKDPIDMTIEGVFQTLQAHRSNKRLLELLGPKSKDCIHLNQIATEIYPEKTAPLIAAILGLNWENTPAGIKNEISLVVRWIINIILSMSIFGSGTQNLEEEKDLLELMFRPVLEKLIQQAL